MNQTVDSPFEPLMASLPIHARKRGRTTLFYAPGYLAVVDGERSDEFRDRLRAGATAEHPVAGALVRQGAAATTVWDSRGRQPFAPVCLTLYLNAECGLACRYCLADPGARRAARLSVAAVVAAAEVVAGHCRRRRRDMTVVFHGGGEPALDPGYAGRLLEEVEAVAHRSGVALFRYLATGGGVSPVAARWMAGCFDRIGLSCDGPPDIQNHLRPYRSGAASSTDVETMASLIHAAGKPLQVRVTVTADTAHRQAQIAAYLCARLRPEEIRVEPVYPRGRAMADPAGRTVPAEAFVRGFLEGRRRAGREGVRWNTSGCRLGEIHGAHCHLWRDVLQVVPGDQATVCFADVRPSGEPGSGLVTGRWDGQRGWEIDPGTLDRLRQELGREPSCCQTCFLRYHCARGCPSWCPGSEADAGRPPGCDLWRRLGQALLDEEADRLLRAAPNTGIRGGYVGHE